MQHDTTQKNKPGSSLLCGGLSLISLVIGTIIDFFFLFGQGLGFVNFIYLLGAMVFLLVTFLLASFAIKNAEKVITSDSSTPEDKTTVRVGTVFGYISLILGFLVLFVSILSLILS